MKISLPEPSERRRLIINPWLEEYTTVPLQFQPGATVSPASKCVRKWESWRSLPIPRDRSAFNRWARGKS